MRSLMRFHYFMFPRGLLVAFEVVGTSEQTKKENTNKNNVCPWIIFSSVFHRKGILGAFHTEFSPPFSVLLFLLSSQFIQLITGQPLTMRIEGIKTTEISTFANSWELDWLARLDKRRKLLAKRGCYDVLPQFLQPTRTDMRNLELKHLSLMEN